MNINIKKFFESIENYFLNKHFEYKENIYIIKLSYFYQNKLNLSWQRIDCDHAEYDDSGMDLVIYIENAEDTDSIMKQIVEKMDDWY